MSRHSCIGSGLLAGLLFTVSLAYSQGVGIGTTTPSKAAVLELRSSNQGLLLPRIKDTTYISKPEAGLLVFSLLDNTLYLYTGVSWMKLAFNNAVTFTYNGASATYGTLVSPTTGRTWLDRNVGAAQAALASTDYYGYGDLFQWGRLADGHQLINWTSATTGTPVNGTTARLSHSDVPGNSLFIVPNYGYSFDWRISPNNNLWQGVDGINNPCPAGWHVPTKLEWDNEIAIALGGTAKTGGITNSNSAYNLLKLPEPGSRSDIDGMLHDKGIYGFYWCSTLTSNGNTQSIYFNGSSVNFSQYDRIIGYSVRCIK